MKKSGVFNSQIAGVLADMGHFDTISIGDAGMPVPPNCKKIDLCVTMGEPKFIDVLQNVLTELEVQRFYLAEEIKKENPQQAAAIKALLPTVPVTYMPHAEMKQALGKANNKAFIRTGECSPYSNIMLESGVIF